MEVARMFRLYTNLSHLFCLAMLEVKTMKLIIIIIYATFSVYNKVRGLTGFTFNGTTCTK